MGYRSPRCHAMARGTLWKSIFFREYPHAQTDGKNDRMRAVANVGSAEGVWCDDVSSSVGVLPLSVPEDGHYQVILVKICPDAPSTHDERKSACDCIGYTRKFHPEWHSTAEIMKELRDGEED